MRTSAKQIVLKLLIGAGAIAFSAHAQTAGNSPNTSVFIGDSITAFGNALESGPGES